MNFKGTKGRWSFSPQKGKPGHCQRAQIWTTSKDEYVASIAGTENEEEAHYNAKIMAAAPLLAKALTDLKDDLEAWSDIGEANRKMINEALYQAL